MPATFIDLFHIFSVIFQSKLIQFHFPTFNNKIQLVFIKITASNLDLYFSKL